MSVRMLPVVPWQVWDHKSERVSASVWVGGFDDGNVDEDVSDRNRDLLGLIKECVLAARSVVCQGSDT